MPSEKSSLSGECQAFFDHWQSLCARDEFVPTSEEFLSKPSPRFSPRIAILERHGHDFVSRLVATELVAEAGRDSTGVNFLAGMVPAVTAPIMANFIKAIEWPCGYHAQAGLRTSRGRRIEMQMLMLPLLVKSGRPQRIVGFKSGIEVEPIELPLAWERALDHEWLDLGRGCPSQDDLGWKPKK